MILSETIGTLGEADLNQRYKNTWIEYDGQIILCVGFEDAKTMRFNIPVDPKFAAKKIPKKKEEVLFDGFGIAGGGGDVEIQLPPLPRPQPAANRRHAVGVVVAANQRMMAARRLGLNPAINDINIVEEYEIAQVNPVRHAQDAVQIRVRDFDVEDDGVGHDYQLCQFDYRKLNTARLPCRWYPVTNGVAYLTYTNQRQYQRGYCVRNTYITNRPHNIRLDNWDWFRILNAMLQERGTKVIPPSMEGFMDNLQKKQAFLISNCLAVSSIEKWDNHIYEGGSALFYRNAKIGDIDSAKTGQIKLLNPAFKQELVEKVKGIERLIV